MKPMGKMEHSDGLYSFVYAGLSGVGIGVFRIEGGALTGCDSAGSKYKATIEADSGSVGFVAHMTVQEPANTWVVSGTSPLDMPIARTYRAPFPTNFADGAPFSWPHPTGPVLLMCRPVDESWAPYLKGFVVSPAGS